jgi:hypothetical protein
MVQELLEREHKSHQRGALCRCTTTSQLFGTHCEEAWKIVRVDLVHIYIDSLILAISKLAF